MVRHYMLMEVLILGKIIMTAGCYDLFHFGHINILLEAKKLGDYLIVSVSTDELIKKYKGIEPIISYEDRVAIIKELKCVNKVVKQKKLVDINQFKKLGADLFVLGDDWKNRYDVDGINWLRDNNKIAWVPYTNRLSTTSIKKKIINQSDDILSNLKERKK